MNLDNMKSNKLNFLTRLTSNDFSWRKPSGLNGKCIQNQIYEAVHGFGWEEWLLNDYYDRSQCLNDYCYGFIQAFNGKNKEYKIIDKLFLYTRKIENGLISNYYVGYIEDVEIVDNSLYFDKYEEKCKEFCIKSKRDLELIGIKNFQSELMKMCTMKMFYNVMFKPDNVHFHLQNQCSIKLEKGQFRFALYDLNNHLNLLKEVLRIENNINL